jgi:cyclohexanone monooxygenase
MAASGSGPGRIDIDVDELKKKYAEERDKRLRPDALDQYQELTGRFAEFDWDRHADPHFTRPAIAEDCDVLIIGGGFAGLLSGGRLRERGVDSIRIVEKGADFGGTWYWNRYPGAACDIESYIYMPLLEETGYLPTEKYAKAPEIYAHCRRLAEHYDLYRAALFQTEVRALRWNEERSRWIVSTSRGDSIAARFVVSCTGLLSKPKLPGIPGIETFRGHAFHTSRWDYAYTGGDEHGRPMTGLADKTVAIIGTGSTGIQAIPELAKYARHLYVFQRTPSSIDARGNRPTDPEWARTLQPGWSRRRRENFTNLTSGIYEPVDLVNDSWTEIIRSIGAPTGGEASQVDPAQLQVSEMKKMEMVRRRISATVRDPSTAEALKPYYHYYCKRPCFHDEYLPAFNRENVTLVDTQGKGVERITPAGLVVDGKEYPVDCIVYATGFDFMTEYTREAGVEVFGRGGRSLGAHWSEGARTVYGIQVHGFPNFFLMSLVQAGVSQNYVHIADEQTQHIAYVIAQCRDRGITEIEPTREAEDAWVEEIVASGASRRAFLESCTPSLFNYEGRRPRFAELNGIYGGGPVAYIALLQAWRAGGDLRGMRTTPDTADVEASSPSGGYEVQCAKSPPVRP